MLFSALHRQKSAPRRVLLFPKVWAVGAQGEVQDPDVETSRRLLRKAARRYRVLLVPVDPFVGTGTEGKGDGKEVDVDDPKAYSLASMFALAEFERVLYLEPPGVLLDSSSLDALLAFAPQQSVAALPADEMREVVSTSLLLIRPSARSFNHLLKAYPSHRQSDTDLFRHAFPAPGSLLSDTYFISPDALMADTASLTRFPETFNASSYLSSTAYVRIWDPELPGPEYNIPYQDKLRVRPKVDAARNVWDRIYEGFRQERMEVCGLDLETWRTSDEDVTSEESEVVDVVQDNVDVFVDEVHMVK